MSLYTLQRRELLSHKWKYVGFFISGLSILYTLIHHYIEPNLLFKGLHSANMIFAAGLIIAIWSEESSEDERVNHIRTNVFTILSYFFIGFIFFNEIGGDPRPIILDLSAILTVYLLVFHFIYYYDTEWILQNRRMFWFYILVVFIAIYILYGLLWLT